MNKGKPIVVRMNGKKKKTKQKSDAAETTSFQSAEQEQAAAIENNDDTLPAFTRKPDKINSLPEKKARGAIKPIVLAIVAAVIIGSVLGFIMLNMIAGIDDNASKTGGQQTAANADTDDKEHPDAAGEEVMSAYVLQGGVFTEKENADKWAEKFTQAGFPAVIWEKESQYYLLTGIADSEEQAKEQAGEMQSSELDAFAKEWETAEMDETLSETEIGWLGDFQSQWSHTLTSITKGNDTAPDKWQKLLDSQPEDSEVATGLAKEIEDSLTAMEKADKQEVQDRLLSMWKKYDSLIQA